VNGAQGFIKYSALDTSAGFAGVVFEGYFLQGTNPGKLVTLGFPFETIYNPDIRGELMAKILTFFDYAAPVDDRIRPDAASTFQLFQNYPNPFNQRTTIKFNLPRAGRVKLFIYNTLGQKVDMPVNQWLESGLHMVRLAANDLSSGTYFYRLETEHYSQTRSMILMK
jgi:hypothetical protein